MSPAGASPGHHTGFTGCFNVMVIRDCMELKINAAQRAIKQSGTLLCSFATGKTKKRAFCDQYARTRTRPVCLAFSIWRHLNAMFAVTL